MKEFNQILDKVSQERDFLKGTAEKLKFCDLRILNITDGNLHLLVDEIEESSTEEQMILRAVLEDALECQVRIHTVSQESIGYLSSSVSIDSSKEKIQKFFKDRDSSVGIRSLEDDLSEDDDFSITDREKYRQAFQKNTQIQDKIGEGSKISYASLITASSSFLTERKEESEVEQPIAEANKALGLSGTDLEKDPIKLIGLLTLADKKELIPSLLEIAKKGLSKENVLTS